jgi:hypothetical protein
MLSWSVILVFLYRANRIFRKVEVWAEDLPALRADMNIVMTNHLPHIQIELEHTNENISGLREDVKDGFSRLADSMNVVLSRIP